MRITWLFGTAAVASAFFGIGLLAVPGPLLTVYGLTTTPEGEVVARVLGAQLVGYVLVEWFAIRGGREVRVANVRSVFVAEVLSLAVTAMAALQGRGNTLFLGVVAIFLVFSLWRGYYLISYEREPTIAG